MKIYILWSLLGLLVATPASADLYKYEAPKARLSDFCKTPSVETKNTFFWISKRTIGSSKFGFTDFNLFQDSDGNCFIKNWEDEGNEIVDTSNGHVILHDIKNMRRLELPRPSLIAWGEQNPCGPFEQSFALPNPTKIANKSFFTVVRKHRGPVSIERIEGCRAELPSQANLPFVSQSLGIATYADIVILSSPTWVAATTKSKLQKKIALCRPIRMTTDSVLVPSCWLKKYKKITYNTDKRTMEKIARQLFG